VEKVFAHGVNNIEAMGCGEHVAHKKKSRGSSAGRDEGVSAKTILGGNFNRRR